MPPQAPPPRPRPILKPSFFLVRSPQGAVVPLVPVDELPFGLIGVSKSLEIEDTIGMLNLGLVAGSELKYEVADELNLVGSLLKGTAGCNTLSSPTATSTKPHEPTPSISLPHQPICKHWCSHGTCRWTPNCRYKHQMPLTLAGLASVGLADWPLWFRAENPEMFAAVGPRLEGFASLQEDGIEVGSKNSASGGKEDKKVRTERYPRDNGDGKTTCPCGSTHAQDSHLRSSRPRRHVHPRGHPYPYPPGASVHPTRYPAPRPATCRPLPAFHPPPARVTAAQIRRIMQEMSLSAPTPQQERLKAAEQSLRAAGGLAASVFAGETETNVAGGKEGLERKGEVVKKGGKNGSVSLELMGRDAGDWAEEDDEGDEGVQKRRSRNGKGGLKSKGRLVDV